MQILNLVLAGLSTLSLTVATELLVNVPASPNIPNPAVLPPSTAAILTTLYSQFTTPLQIDNAFHFRNVTEGSYLLEVQCASHAFAPLRVDISQTQRGQGKRSVDITEEHEEEVKAWGTFRGNEWSNTGEKVDVREADLHGRKAWGMDVRALGEKSYFIDRHGFSPLGLLQNPMILIAGVTLLIVVGMPYLMDNMDPELKAEFDERQKSGGSVAANPLQNFDPAAWLAGSSSKSASGNGSSGSSLKKIEEKGITR